MNRGVNAAPIEVVAAKKGTVRRHYRPQADATAKDGAEPPSAAPPAGDKTEGSTMAKVLAGANERTATEAPQQPVKDLYEVGEIPPLGHVPPRIDRKSTRLNSSH